jgi:hypothetical protein
LITKKRPNKKIEATGNSLVAFFAEVGCPRASFSELDLTTGILHASLGASLAKGQLRFSVLEGTQKRPTLVETGRLVTTDPEDVPALMSATTKKPAQAGFF